MTENEPQCREVRYLGSATNELGRIASTVERRCAEAAADRAAARSSSGDPVIVTLDDVQAAKTAVLQDVLGRYPRWQRVLKMGCSWVGAGLIATAVSLAVNVQPVVHPLWLVAIAVVGAALIAAAAFMEWRSP